MLFRSRPFVAPPEIPADRREALRSAFDETMKDADFLADAEKAKLEFDFVLGEEIDKVVKIVAETPAEIADLYAKAFSPDR